MISWLRSLGKDDNMSKSSFDVFGIMKSTGIVGVLFGMGLILYLFHISEFLGIASIIIAIVIGSIYAFLGIMGILKKQGF